MQNNYNTSQNTHITYNAYYNSAIMKWYVSEIKFSLRNKTDAIMHDD